MHSLALAISTVGIRMIYFPFIVIALNNKSSTHSVCLLLQNINKMIIQSVSRSRSVGIGIYFYFFVEIVLLNKNALFSIVFEQNGIDRTIENRLLTVRMICKQTD